MTGVGLPFERSVQTECRCTSVMSYVVFVSMQTPATTMQCGHLLRHAKSYFSLFIDSQDCQARSSILEFPIT